MVDQSSANQNSATGTTIVHTPLGDFPIGGSPVGTTQSPIGVPSGYKAPTQTESAFPTPGGQHTSGIVTDFGTAPNSTQYMGGQEWSIPLSSPEQIPTLKQSMLQAGLLTAKTFGNPGVWDANDATAYTKILTFANAYGLNATDAMSYFVSNPVATKGPTQPIISFANPVDVQTGYQNVSQSLTGQEQDPAAFQQEYHDEEAASQHLRGQNYTQAPSVTGAATQYVQNNLAPQELAYGTASRMQDFLSMLGQ